MRTSRLEQSARERFEKRMVMNETVSKSVSHGLETRMVKNEIILGV
jgi:hypothetical protein